MAIPEDIIERVRLSSDIVSVVREYLPDLKRAGRNWKACCPFHNEKTPSFVVSPEKGIFRCFGCNAAGDVFKFVILMDNISWVESVRKLAKKSGIEIQETKDEAVKVSEKTKLFEILESSARFYNRCFLESSQAAKARKYLEKRGINADTVKKFMIGYAPKGQLIAQAAKKGYASEVLLKAGIITKTERGNYFEYMSERVVFPIFDVQGRVVAFGGRSLSDDQQPKYLNTPETVVYSKSSNLYGLFQTLPELRKERKIIVLEGYMDVVIPWQFGITGAVASLGTAFTQNHAKLIARYADSVTLLFDADNAGRTAAQRALEILVENGTQCSVSSLPEGVDADEYLNENGKEKFLELVEKSSKSAIEFMIGRVSSDIKKNIPETKAKAVSALLDFVSRSADNVIQREWIKTFSQHINVDEEAVWRELKKKQRNKLLKNVSAVGENKIFAADEKKIGLSLEENLLNLIMRDRKLIENIAEDIFTDIRCSRIFSMLASGHDEAGILNSLSENDSEWFTAVTLSPIEYNNIEEVFNTILKDINAEKLKRRRKELEKEIILMSTGQAAVDSGKQEEYKKLTALLKGSGK